MGRDKPMLTISPRSTVAADFANTCNGVVLTVLEDTACGVLELELTTGFPHDDVFVFLPACCYDGTRFEVLKRRYPPLFHKNEARLDMPVTITDIPRLEKDGSGCIEVTTGDVSVPCVGLFSPSAKHGLLFYTVQQVEGVNLGLAYTGGKITVSLPHFRRTQMYRWPRMVPSTDQGRSFSRGQQIHLPCRLLEFPCESILAFYRIFFETRKSMKLDDARPTSLPAGEQWRIQADKLNRMNWREPCGFYSVGTTDEPGQVWQPGWVGGAISTLPLARLGGPLERERALRTLEFLFRQQAPTGFFYESADLAGNPHGMEFGGPGTEHWHLVRKSADVLYYLFPQLEWMREQGIPIPGRFLEGTRRVADAFVGLWRKYGQWGQFVDLETGELAVGGSTCAAIAPVALVRAYRWFGDPTYLEIALAGASQFYDRDLSAGYTCGGPGDMLQCPDSESAFALLESFAELYEETGDSLWLDRTEQVASYCSTWVVAYNYRLPEGSEFHRLDMKTVGCVFANLQNKHAAPGICTLSGMALWKLYRWTGNDAYLELLRDIVASITTRLLLNE